MEKLYTTNDVAKLTKQHVKTVLRHISEGKLKTYKAGNRHRISEEQIKAYMDIN